MDAIRTLLSFLFLSLFLTTSAFGQANATNDIERIKRALVATPNGDYKKRAALAYELLAKVATQSAANHQNYVNQANAEAGVPDLIQMLANSRQVDARTPHVVV